MSWRVLEGPKGLGGSSRVLEGPEGIGGSWRVRGVWKGPVGSWRVLEGPEGLGGSSRVLEGLGESWWSGGSGRVQ